MYFRFLFLFITFITSMQLHALSDAAKLDMLKMKLTQQLKAEQYPDALSTMQELKALKINLPSSFTYFEGKVLFETGSHSAAYERLEQYINENGSNGKYYQQALAYLIKAEEESKQLKKKIATARNTVENFFDVNHRIEGDTEDQIILDLKIKECSIDVKTGQWWYGQYENSKTSWESSIPLIRINEVEFINSKKGQIPYVSLFRNHVNTFYTNTIISEHGKKSFSEKEAFKKAIMILKKNAIESGCK